MVRAEPDAWKWSLNLTESSEKLAHWRLRLSYFELYIVHTAGIKHQAAATLPRLKTVCKDETPIEVDITVLFITTLIAQEKKRRGLYICKAMRQKATTEVIDCLNYTC